MTENDITQIKSGVIEPHPMPYSPTALMRDLNTLKHDPTCRLACTACGVLCECVVCGKAADLRALFIGAQDFPVSDAEAVRGALAGMPDDDLSVPAVVVLAACMRCAGQGKVRKVARDVNKLVRLGNMPQTERRLFNVVSDISRRNAVALLLSTTAMHKGGIVVRRALLVDAPHSDDSIVVMDPVPDPPGAFRQMTLPALVDLTGNVFDQDHLLPDVVEAIKAVQATGGWVQ